MPDEAVGSIIEKLGTRKAEMTNMEANGSGRTVLEFVVAARALIGFRGDFIRSAVRAS